MSEYLENSTPEQDAEFIPEHVQEYFADTLHIFAGVRMDNGIGGLSVQSALIDDDAVEVQYARLMLSESLHEMLDVIDGKIKEWFDNPDNARDQE